MASSWCAENAVLSIYQLLDAIRSTNLGNQLHYLWVVIASITTNDQEGPLHAFWDREQDRCSEGLRVMRLLKDGDLLAQARGAWFLVAEGLERDFLDAHRGGVLNWKTGIWGGRQCTYYSSCNQELECVVSVDW